MGLSNHRYMTIGSSVRCSVGMADDSGFTLLEVMMSVLVLSMVAIAVLPMMVTGTKMQYKTQTRAQALNYARQQVDSKIADLKNTNSWPTSKVTLPAFSDDSLDPDISKNNGTGILPSKPDQSMSGVFEINPVDVPVQERTIKAYCLKFIGEYKDNTSSEKGRIVVERFIVPGVM